MVPILPYLLSRPAHAHQGVTRLVGLQDYSQLPDAEPWVWLTWDLHPSVIIGCLALTVLYLWLARRWPGPGDVLEPWRRRRFAAAMVILLVSLQGPMHHLADNYLFSAHMLQHLLLTLFFPPLFITAIPPWMVQRLVDVRGVGAVVRWVTSAGAAFFLYNAVLALWHLPFLYEATMQDHGVHIVEHLLFLATAVLAWWPIYGTLPELSPLGFGMRAVYLFLLSLPMKLLGALITVSDDVLYGFYATVPRVSGLDPLADQRLGGLIMWVPTGLVIWVSIGVLFFRWWASEQPPPRPYLIHPAPR